LQNQELEILKIIKLMEKSILLHCITPDELKQIIKEVIQDELKEVSKQPEEKDSEALLSRKETCEFLKISLTTLWHWTNNGKIDSYGIGNRVYYKKVDLLNSLVLLK
jgi:DNA invertase Pin-like site-specific DNA recombinase